MIGVPVGQYGDAAARGLNRPGEMENRFGELLATLTDT